ncbi:arylsulfatase J-like [Dermacentor silvarum]|uniref:arylsulfatase J-like n=1 Tax=Dermacentor silvarum TaxID=543639 RepID=UPI002100B948|nr:arylsulfatase J-like [Dermacentor silvarum]
MWGEGSPADLLAGSGGWNDVSFHGSRQIPTPNIDALAANGVVLQRHYSTPVCTPSRSAFFTSRYPPRTDLGYGPLPPAGKGALPLRFEVLPQWLKRLGYSTHMVGKWHLGYKSLEHTPTWRGFDTFFGYYNGQEFYFNHTTASEDGQHCGLDLWRNVGNTTQAVTDLNGVYSTYAFTDEAKRIIAKHNPAKSTGSSRYRDSSSCSSSGSVWCPNEKKSLGADKLDDVNTRIGALAVMDRSIGELLAALQAHGMLADSVVAFVSDNGAAPLKATYPANAGSNWPLRGVKKGVWEGAVRTPAVFWHAHLRGPLPRPPSQQMMHLVDWAPTFYAAAGGDVSHLGDVDGKDQWEALSTGNGNQREDVILVIEGWNDESAIISGRYKLVNRSQSYSDPLLDSRVAPPEGEPPVDLDLDSLMESSQAWKALQQATFDAGTSDRSAPRANWRQELIIKCSNDNTSEDFSENFDAYDTVFVFDVFSDPCELNNLASTEPEV